MAPNVVELQYWYIRQNLSYGASHETDNVLVCIHLSPMEPLLLEKMIEIDDFTAYSWFGVDLEEKMSAKIAKRNLRA